MINLTPHPIVLRGSQGDVTIPPSGTLARVASIETQTGEAVAGLAVVRRKFGEVTGLPGDGTPCIVSALVLSAIPAGTPGVYAPDTGPTAVRDEKGHIVAVTRLVAA